MKVIVNVPLRATREYLDDFIEGTIPNVDDRFDDKHVVTEKQIDREKDVCTLDLSISYKDGHI